MERPRDVRSLTVPEVGSVRAAQALLAGWELVDVSGEPVTAVSVYLHHLAVADFSLDSRRVYALALLRWLRFLNAVETA